MEETKEVKVKKKKKLSKSGIVLIIGITVIAIPVIVFLAIIGIAELQKGSPREGSRFDNDLTPEITKENVNSIKADLETLDNVETVDVVLSEGQLKVYIDLNDTCNEKDVDNAIALSYQKVGTALPITTYFSKSDTAKMYDLQINVYTTASASENRQYKLLHKNSAEEQFSIDDLAHPKDPKLVAELQGKTVSDDTTVEEEKPTE